MTLRADVHLDSPEMVIGRTIRETTGVTFEADQQATADVLFISVQIEDGDRSRFEDLEANLEADPTISEFRLWTDGGEERVYAVDIDVNRPLVAEVAGELGINVRALWARGGDSGWTFELEVPDRDALVDFRRYWDEMGMGFELRRLFYQSESQSEVYGLSENQRETLLVAFEEGYFEVPRGISQRELAEQFDASPTAVSQRLRRAIAALVANTVAAQAVPPED